MAKKEALGKGLDALLGGANISRRPPVQSVPKVERAETDGESSDSVLSNGNSSNEGRIAERSVTSEHIEQRRESKELAHSLLIPISNIQVNPHQPRRIFDPEQLELLCQSIRAYGLIQPITVRRESEGHYQLISGERRLRACRMAGLTEVPAYIRDADDRALMELALVENLQREDLNPIEIALSLQRLQQEYNYTQEELGDRVGMARTSVANFLRLLRLSPVVQHAIQSKKLSMGHAKVLLGVELPEQQEYLCRLVEEQDLSIRALEEALKSLPEDAPSESAIDASSRVDSEQPDYLDGMQRLLESKLGWGVRVQAGKRGAGRVVISYRSDGEREELMRRLGLVEPEE